jgi:hypothetical protein
MAAASFLEYGNYAADRFNNLEQLKGVSGKVNH